MDKINIRDLIKTIVIEPSNFRYCADNNIINGTLLVEIERIMQIHTDKQLLLHGVVCQREQLSCETCKFLCEDWDEKHPCADCAGFEHWEAT